MSPRSGRLKGAAGAVESDTVAPDLALACPRCAAALRPGAPWCTQCFLDVRPAPPRHRARLPDPEPGPEPGPAAAAAPAEPGGARWPCAACGARNPLAATSCDGCGAGFLDGVHAGAAGSLALPVVGDLTRLSPARRMALAAAVVVVVMLLTALLGLLTG